MRLSGAVAAAFFSVLIMLGIVSHVQQLHSLGAGIPSIELLSAPNALTLHVQHMISHLKLHRNASSATCPAGECTPTELAGECTHTELGVISGALVR